MSDVNRQETYLEEAKRITLEDRQVTYAHPAINFLDTAIRWTLRKKNQVVFTPYDVAMFLGDVKQSRETNLHKRDNLVDTIGYVSTVDRIDEFMRGLGYWKGIRIFTEEEWTLSRLISLYEEVQRQVPLADPPIQSAFYDPEIPF